MHLCIMSDPEQEFGAVIPLGWPETTARGSEKIWDHLRTIGIVKNINLLVGHAAMIIVEHDKLRYFDFGRYLTPRTMGRVRSSETDPILELKTVPHWSDSGKLINFIEILNELEKNSFATHGAGSIYASVYYKANTNKVLKYAQSIQNIGFLGYNGIDRKCTNCARFVSRALMAGLPLNSKEFMKFRFPATIIAPTPYSNVLTGASGEGYCIFLDGVATFHNRPKRHGLAQILSNLTHAFRKSKAIKLPSDKKTGHLFEPDIRPFSVPKNAKYIGGIGEGAWHYLEKIDDKNIKMTKYSILGDIEFHGVYDCRSISMAGFTDDEYELVHDTHYAWITLRSKLSGYLFRCLRLK